MDTRLKILHDPGELSTARGFTLVAGYFDVLRAESVREMERAGPQPVVAVVLDGPDTILPLRSRAELAAGLRSVDYVFTAAEGEIDALASKLRAGKVVRLEENDQRRAAELREHVKRRQTCRTGC